MNLDELEALANAATPGPWRTGNGGNDLLAPYKDRGWAMVLCCDGESEQVLNNGNPNDLSYIAAANPETLKALIALCRTQHEALKHFAEHVEYSSGKDEVGVHSCCGEVSYKQHEEDCDAQKALAAFEQFGNELK